MAVPERKADQLQSAHSTGSNHRVPITFLLLAGGLLSANAACSKPNDHWSHAARQRASINAPLVERAMRQNEECDSTLIKGDLIVAGSDADMRFKTAIFYNLKYLESPDEKVRDNAVETIKDIVSQYPEFRWPVLQKTLMMLKNEDVCKTSLFEIISSIAQQDRGLMKAAIYGITGIDDALTLEKLHLISPLDAARLYEVNSACGPDAIRKIVWYYNLTFFGRYSTDTLVSLYQNIGTIPEKPVAVVIYPLNDGNGAFYNCPEIFDKIRENYTLYIVEAGNRQEFVGMLRKIRIEKGEFSLLVIGGHGDSVSLQLGYDEEDELDVEHEKPMQELNYFMKRGGDIILDSCSTGNTYTYANLARALSKLVPGEWVFAPQNAEYYIQAIELRDGHVQDVKYFNTDETIYFDNVLRFGK